MPSLQTRNGWFHLLFRYQGRQYSQALKTGVRREAEALRGSVDRLLIRIHNHELAPPAADVDVVAYLLAGGRVPETPAPVPVPALTLTEFTDRYGQAHANGA